MNIVIVAARRTPFGRFGGALAQRSAVELGTAAARAVLETIGPDAIDRVIVGNVLAAANRLNVARQIALASGIPIDRPAFTVNMACASGAQAVILAAQSILAGESEVVLCGGVESMSNAPYLVRGCRRGYRLGDGALDDALLWDGLVDPTTNRQMGELCEQLAADRGIERAAQDAFALRSQRRAAQAQASGVIESELIMLPELDRDEHPRPDVTLEELTALRPVFSANGTITAGNASGLNDGAAMLVCCASEVARRRGWQPLAVIADYVTVGCDPSLMGLGPVFAVRRLLHRFGRSLDQFDLVELNEAFAVQALVCQSELGLAPERVNVDGGAIAWGHPVGATGARLLVHLAHQLNSGRGDRGLATLCVGGGMGLAIALGSHQAGQGNA